MWTCAGVLVLVACASAVTRDQFYPYGPGLDQNLPKGNDVPSLELPLRVPITFYGETHESVFINNFGVLTFRADISSFLAVEFPLPYASIAAFYSNIDTTSGGAVYFRETSEPHVLSKAEESVQNNFHDYYDFTPSSVFIATWVDVPYTANVTSNTPRNSFQVAVISNGNESFVELLYPERDIQWTQKEYQSTNLPDPKAQAGFISEDGRIYALRGSGSHQIKNIAFWSNTHEPGKYVFRVGEIPLEGNIATPDQYNQDEIEIEQESKTCAISGPILCHSDAKCIDYPAGICCQCKDGFYGNGKTCIRNNLPLRVHGKINGILNDIHLNDVDIQAYVVVGEGRAYTALTLLPPELGSSLQLLNVLGGVIGWLFANPLGSAKNGYQMTGSVFNHSADVWFPASGARVRINQEYLGHDAFDQISLETDVRGTLPVILTGTKLDVTDYEEQFTLIEPGIIRSDSSKTFTNRITGEQIEQRITQTISFSPCRFASPSVEDKTPATLKVIRNYLGYENRENIVRYGMTNKIFPLGQEDPCIKGRSTCGPHSACVAHENTYNCVCQSGFTSILQNNAVVCIDIDECQADTHNCDDNAECYNHAGGFQCRCRPGFTGNGVTCNPISTCYNKKCDSNAQCIEYPGQEAVCVCNFGFVGDGQLCYLDISHGDLPAANNEADYNDSIVLPNCNEYGCSCPPGYSDYRDTSGNQLCRLENYGGPPQELSTNTYQRPTEPSNYPPTESYYRQTEHPYQSSTESTSPPTTNYRPDQGNYQQNLYNPYNNYPQNNYDQNSGDNIPYGISQPSEFNNQEPTENNYPPSGYNYEQGPDNNNQPPSENNYHHQWGNNYPPSDNYGQQEGNYYQTSDRNSETPPPTSYSQSNQQTSSENEYQQSTVTEDNLQSCEEDAECPPNAVCSNKHCVCPEGYEGDGFECIERTGSYCSCGSNARCVNTGSNEYYCVCDLGYQGDGYICQPNNYGCRNNSDCELNAECRPDSHSNEYICQCVQGYVKDHNDACILDAQLCNGALCASHASCLSDREMGLDYCHCDEGYTGDGISQCVVAEQTCEVTNNCSPYAVCTPVDNSYQCICAEGYTGDGYSCTQDVTCRYDPNICDLHASCLKRNDAYACECNAGYNGDGHSCELNARPAGNFLVTSDGASVYKVPFRITPTHYAIPFNSDISQIAVGIDVDCESGTIFWGDVVSYSIKSSRYDGSGYEAFLVDGVYTPEGIAVDWLSRNIFWTDSKKLTIEVANMDTKARKVLFAIKDISNPRGIAVHPQRGKIFWSDWKRTDPKIEWASMDGTQRGIFLDKSDVTLPNSLAIDWIRDRLCYADPGLSSIKCVSIDSREKETVAANCSFPFGLAIHGNKFYWSDWRTMNIEFVDVETKERGSMSIVSHGSKRLYDIAVAPDQCPQMYSICMQRNGGCGVNQLCLPDGNNGRSCVDADATFSRRRR